MSFNKKPKAINPDLVDPSVYYYDEVYDEMKEVSAEAQKTSNSSGGANREPSKYIKGILETAEERKTERELRKFKKIARDREESEMDADDEEVYITEAYQKKLDEMKKIEDQRRRIAQEDAKKTMNFVKTNEPSEDTERRRDGHTRKKSRKSDHNKSSCDTPNDNDSKITSRHAPDDEATERLASDIEHPQSSKLGNIEIVEQDEKAPQSRRKPLKTQRERRHYLRKVLAKRTVGQAFEDAVRRYKQRRTLS